MLERSRFDTLDKELTEYVRDNQSTARTIAETSFGEGFFPTTLYLRPFRRWCFHFQLPHLVVAGDDGLEVLVYRSQTQENELS